jgi:hypothetical protein
VRGLDADEWSAATLPSGQDFDASQRAAALRLASRGLVKVVPRWDEISFYNTPMLSSLIRLGRSMVVTS